jgi:hypothetical protein
MRTGPSRPSPAAGSSVTMSATPRALMPFRLARHAARRVFGGKQAPQRGFGGGHLALAPAVWRATALGCAPSNSSGAALRVSEIGVGQARLVSQHSVFGTLEVSNCRSDALHPVSGDLHGGRCSCLHPGLAPTHARDAQNPVRRPRLFADVRLVGHWCAQRPPWLACGLRRRACRSRSSSAGCQTRLQ